MNNLIIEEEYIKGQPLQIESYLKIEMANQILKMGANDYENVVDNMRMTADLFEIIEENINKDIIILKYNPMGSWFLSEEEE